MIQNSVVENGHLLFIQFPHITLFKSIFCLTLRGFCSHHHLDRQVSSAEERPWNMDHVGHHGAVQ